MLLARELLYRTCEAGVNGFLEADDVAEQHGKIIAALTDMITAQSEASKAKKAEAEAKAVQAAAAASVV